jgi:hypothetical protein
VTAHAGLVTVTTPDLIQFLRGTQADAQANNPHLEAGEPAWDEFSLRVGPMGGGDFLDQPFPVMQGPGSITTISANYSATIADRFIVADGFGGGTVLTMPDPADMPGQWVLVKNLDGTNLLVLSTTVGKGFDSSGSSTINLLAGHGVLLVAHTNGSVWVKFSM